MSWCYSPAAIATSDDTVTTISSGVFIAEKKTGVGYIVTSTKLLTEVFATVDAFVTDDKVEWAAVELISTKALNSMVGLLSRLGSQYVIKPDQPSLSVLKFIDNGAHKRALKSDKLRQFELASQQTGPIKIHCTPFGSVNSAMFLGYLAHGNISRALPGAILTDTRFLEGMNGGIAFLDNKKDVWESIGIVVGYLHKRNGEGDLTIIAPWRDITRAIDTIMVGPQQSISEITPSNNNLAAVVALLVKRVDGTVVWGSGVLVAPLTIVTNAHVVRNAISVTAWFSKHESVKMDGKKTPIVGVDLAVLELEDSTKHRPLELASEPVKAGDNVISVGYGIFHPHTAGNRPLASAGKISQVVKFPIEQTNPRGEVMYISSAGCWNGSSGGAIINYDNKLVGIMSSNGKLDSGEIIPTMTFVVPASIIDLGLKLASEGKTIQVSDKIRSLWKLEQTHDNVVNSSSSHKL